MTTYTPVGPFTLEPEEGAGLPAPADRTVDALPLLNARQAATTIAPEQAARGRYLALADEHETRLLRLEGSVTHLGRGPDADISFDEDRVSRDHAILVHSGRHVRLLDNRSANGTFVNGGRIAAETIDDGDVIDIGPVRMQLVEVR